MLLSIKPKYVEKIFAGVKKFEFRKKRCKSHINKIIFYSSYPVMKIVGEADIVDIIEDKLEIVWQKTNKESGINKTFYNSYYAGYKTAVAYKLDNIKKYDKPKTLNSIGINKAPQSFIYL